MKKNIVFGPAMIPDTKIYRNPNNTIKEQHEVYFSAKTIAQLREKFHENNFEKNVTINHDGINLTGVVLTNSFLIDSNNRFDLHEEFSDLPDGTWMVEYVIENEEIWEKVKTKKLNGFSIEGLFKYDI